MAVPDRAPRTIPSLLLLAACTEPYDGPTWHADVAPLVAEHCVGCHADEGAGPFRLDDYVSASLWADEVALAVESGVMPPWFAAETDDCQPRHAWKDDLRLTDAEKALLRAWADAGAPEGDPDEAAPLPRPPELSLADPDAHLVPTTPFVATGHDDQFWCFSYDPGLTEDRWLTALQVVPQNTEVVHHVLVLLDYEGASAELAGESGQWDCANMGLGSGPFDLVGVWTPGAVPIQLPEGVGMHLPAGARLVNQMHYHPDGGVERPDATALDLRWTEIEPTKKAWFGLIGNASDGGGGLLPGPGDRTAEPEFRIPAGVADHPEHMRMGLWEDASVWSVGTHMHYVGKGARVVLERLAPEGDEPATECLIETPTWDFAWQRTYDYDAPLEEVPRLREGDTLRVECTYDNTLGNPGVVESLDDQGLVEPVDVFLGDASTDEMCLAILGLVQERSDR